MGRQASTASTQGHRVALHCWHVLCHWKSHVTNYRKPFTLRCNKGMGRNKTSAPQAPKHV